MGFKERQKIRRILNKQITDYNVQGANEFMKYCCAQKFTYRFSIAWSMLRGKPLWLKKV